MDIKGKTAIVTGGGTGIGAAIADRLCSAGAKVMIAGRREQRLKLTTEFIRKSNLEIRYRSTDYGFILMISSDSGIHYFPDQVIYGLTKHGRNDLVQYILTEYKQYNIHSVALCPGLTATEMGLGLNPANRENVLEVETIAEWSLYVITQTEKLNVANPIALSPMRDPAITK